MKLRFSPLSNIYITSPYGVRIHPVTHKKSLHRGIDLRAREGTPIRASFSGEMRGLHTKNGGYTAVVVSRTSKGAVTMKYMHLQSLPETKQVKAGDVIAYTGSTGRVTGPHLHWEVWTLINGVESSINPALLLT